MKKLITLLIAVLILTFAAGAAFADADFAEAYICIANNSDCPIVEICIETDDEADASMENCLEQPLAPGEAFEHILEISEETRYIDISVLDDANFCYSYRLFTEDCPDLEFIFQAVETDDYPALLCSDDGEPLEYASVFEIEYDADDALDEDYEPEDEEPLYADYETGDEQDIKYSYSNVTVCIENYLASDITSVYMKPSSRSEWIKNMLRGGYYIPYASCCRLDRMIWYDEDCKWDLYVYTRGGGWFRTSNLSFEGVSDPYCITIGVYKYTDGTYGHSVK